MRTLILPGIKAHNLKKRKAQSVYTTEELAAIKRVVENNKKINPKKVAVRSRTKKNYIF